MAGNNSVVQSNTLLVKWQEDKASFRKLVKDTTKGWEKIKRAQDKAGKTPSQVSKEARQQINAQRAIQKAIEKRQDKELKQELRVLNAKHKAHKRLNSEQAKVNKQQSQHLKSSVKPKGTDWRKQRERLTGTQAYKFQGMRLQGDSSHAAMSVRSARLDIESARSAREYKRATNELTSALAHQRHVQMLNNQAKRQGTVLNDRLTASMRQMAGEVASVYVAYEGLRSVMSTGMEFEKINKMFLSVSSGSVEAGENFEFLKGQAKRLGLDLKQSGKEYSRYLAMVNESFSKTQAQELFVSMSELSTVRGLSQDQVGRANVAVSQMLAKGKITAEELRQQLAEAGISDAYNMMATAAKEAGLITGKTTVELQANLDKLMGKGKAISYEILPYFTKQLHEAARKNDALNYALKELFSVQLGRAKLQMQLFSDEIWKGGFLEGMRELLVTFNEFELIGKPVAKFIGVTLRNAIITITFPFKVMLQLLRDISAAFGVVFDGDIAMQIAKFVGLASGLILFSTALLTVAKALGVLKLAFTGIFGILGGEVAEKSVSKLGRFYKLLSKVAGVAMAVEGFNLATGISDKMQGGKDAPSTSSLITSGVKTAGYAALMAPHPVVKAGGAIALASAYGSEYIADYFSGLTSGASTKEHQVPYIPPAYQATSSAISQPQTYGGYSYQAQAPIPVEITVKGTDGLIEVVDSKSTEAATMAINQQQERLNMGRE